MQLRCAPVAETPPISSFDFQPGRLLAGRYHVLSFLGGGLEGEVYLVEEHQTGIERALKIFYPQWNRNGEASRRYATKLHRLRHCPIIIQYHGQGTLRFRGTEVSYVVSEYAPGEVLAKFLARQRGGRLQPLAACHLLYALARGLEPVHAAGEYHGDLHTENVIVMRFGLTFQLKLLDFFPRSGRRRLLMQDDIIDVVKIFYDSLGGMRHYRNQPDEVKGICRGLRHSLILGRYPSMTALRRHLEQLSWD